eukprot:CAMPEP_0201645474 /NCGR_PEP_ID=MMETSP0493-20130528/32207_1 /ASSEMBLY_ACC=CAM_ASM_000838 /TAXON_ID=420259 /ORGANISM="Thalassiosira gravida, Strain GMp14c1" /LENGTH=104 /DNA_ID=CAMNT_0048120427 /DNA_START=443 /DNA_END=757 /DNA_ORIENTATION=-
MEYALSTERRYIIANEKDVPIDLRWGACAGDTEGRRLLEFVVTRVARITPSREVSALDMGQIISGNKFDSAAMRDARAVPRKTECVTFTGERLCVAVKDAPTRL